MSTIDPQNTAEETKPDAEPALAPEDLTTGAISALDEALASETPADPEATPAPEAKVTAEPKPAEPGAPAPEKDVETEIAELGLKEKTADRFRELTSYKTALKNVGVTDVAQIPQIIERAKFADELETAIVSTGASPEQYGAAIKYLALVNGGVDGMAKAYDIMTAELAALAKALGREVPGVHDPLAEHEDLRDEVESGDLTRKRAIEIAQTRATQSMEQGRKQQTETQAQERQVFDAAIAQLNTLGASLKASDPAYADKLAVLAPTIKLIRERCPPNEWAARVQEAYGQIKIQAPAAALPPPGPVRSVTPAGVAMKAEPKNAMDALDMALNAVAQAR